MHNITAINNEGISILINDASTSRTTAKVTGTITQEINTINAMDFTLYATNPGYKEMIPFHTRVESINIDGDREFYGRVLKAPIEMSASGEICKKVVCENFMGFLQDSSVGYQVYKGSIQQVINQVFNEHYAKLQKDAFVLRSCEFDEEIEIIAEGETTYAFIMNKIINVYGGEIVLEDIDTADGIYKIFYLSLKNESADINPNDLELGENIIAFSSDRDVTNLCTKVIPYGAKLYTDEDNLERLTIEEVNGGKNYLEVSSPYGVIERTVLFQDIEEAQELLEEAQKYLDDNCNPVITYAITAFDEHLLNKTIPKISIRERHYVTAPILEVDHLLLRITKKTMCIENPANDTFTIGASVDRASAAVAGAVTANDINRVYDVVNTKDTINAYNLSAVKARIDNLDVGDLTAVNAKIQNLQADNAKIQSLIFGTADGQYISVEFSDAVVSQISDGIITNAMIKSLAADKLTAGRISTNLVDIGSDDGMLTIKDNTIQCYDGEYVRVQIGKDDTGDYNLILCDENGNCLWDAKGIGEAAIRSDLIVDRMVSKDAAIHGSKIDMPSLIKEINNGTETIKSSAIVYDPTGQTLDISFNKIVSQLMDDKGYNLYADSITMTEGWVYKGDWTWDEVDKFRAGTSTNFAYLDSTFMPTENVVYTLSAWVKGKVFVYYPTSLETDVEYEESSSWTRVSYTFVYDCKKGKPVFTSENYFSIYGIKLEYGGALTDWCETAEEMNRTSIIEMANVQVANGNISFDLYKKDGLVTKMASITMEVGRILESVNEIGSDYVKSAQVEILADMILEEVSRATGEEERLSASQKINAESITQEVKRATETEADLSTKIQETAKKVAISINEDGEVVTDLTLDRNGLEFRGNKAVFSGALSAASGTFAGELSAASGTFTGKLTSPTTEFIGMISKDGRIYMYDTGTGVIHCDEFQANSHITTSKIYGKLEELGIIASTRVRFYTGSISNGIAIDSNASGKCHLRPGASGSIDCGSTSYHWDNIYADNGEIQTSDRNEKTNIHDMTQSYADALIDGAVPKTYQMINGTSGRTHNGMIAQDLEEQLYQMGLTTQDFAGFVKYEKEDDKGSPTGQYGYGIRYMEYIPAIIKYCQGLKKILQEKDETICRLQNQVTAIQTEILNLKSIK